MLDEHIDDRGLVDYAGLASTGFSELDGVLAGLEHVDEATLAGSMERLAFWIDAYNICMFKAIVRRYPIDSVFSVERVLDERIFHVAGRLLSLRDIERDILAPLSNDPRITLALFRGNRSGPRPRREPYSIGPLDEALDAHEREFLADRERNRFDVTAGRVQVSTDYGPVIQRFAERDGSFAKHLARMAPPQAKVLLDRPGTLIGFMPADFALDEVPGSRPPPGLPVLRSAPRAGSGTVRRL